LSKKFELTILGSGSATPTLNRNPASQILNVQNHLVLIDCGEATQLALRKNKIKFQRINQIFISHLHGDHYLGLPGLLSTFSLLGRTNPLDIFGPADLEKIINLHFSVSGRIPDYPIRFYQVKTNNKKLIFENKIMLVWAFPLKHRIETYGFLFEEKPKLRHINSDAMRKYSIPHYKYNALKQGADYTIEKTKEIIPNEKLTHSASPSFKYAYCSDTAFFPKITGWIENADCLFHETTFMEKDRELAKKTFHSTTIEAAEIAKQAKVGQLIIGHYSARYLNLELLVEECKSIFENTDAATDGKVFSILQPGAFR